MRKLRAAAALLLMSLAISGARASVMAYSSEAAFTAALASSQKHTFDELNTVWPCSNCVSIDGPQVLAGVKFDSSGYAFLIGNGYNYIYGKPFFSGQSDLTVAGADVLISMAPTYAIGFQYGGYASAYGVPLTATLNSGEAFNAALPLDYFGLSFIGFVSTSPISSVKLELANIPSAHTLDIYSVTLGNAAPVPEPSTWGLALGGMLLVGTRYRRSTRR